MTQEELKKVLRRHKLWLDDEDGGARAELQYADLIDATLRGADLRDATLRGANLHGADLRDAKLRGANLRDANLCGAQLRGAQLCGAQLCGANLHGADLRGAKLDYSCLPLWCGGSHFKADIKLVYQILAHVATIQCDDPEFAEIRQLILPFAQKSHRAKNLDLFDDEG